MRFILELAARMREEGFARATMRGQAAHAIGAAVPAAALSVFPPGHD